MNGQRSVSDRGVLRIEKTWVLAQFGLTVVSFSIMRDGSKEAALDQLFGDYFLLNDQAAEIVKKIREDGTKRSELYPILKGLDDRRYAILQEIDRLQGLQ